MNQTQFIVPNADEYGDFYETYVSRFQPSQFLDSFRGQVDELVELLSAKCGENGVEEEAEVPTTSEKKEKLTKTLGVVHSILSSFSIRNCSSDNGWNSRMSTRSLWRVWN